LSFTYGNTASAIYAPCEQALALDPSNVAALSALSLQASGRVSAANSSDRAADIARAGELAARALAADPNSPDAHFAQGNALQVQKRFDEAKGEFERAIALNPSQMAAYGLLALAYFNTGEPEAAITLVEKAQHLSPLDALRANWFGVAGLCSVTLHRDDQAVDWLRRSLAVNDKGASVHIFLAGTLGLIGHDAEAREELQLYLAMPEARVKTIAALKLQRNSDNPSYLATRERFYEGLRKAGMPEE